MVASPLDPPAWSLPGSSTPPPPSPPPSSSGRSPLLLVGVAVLVIAALAVGLVVVLGSGDDGRPAAESDAEEARTYPAAWDPRVASIAEWVAEERGLDFAHPVEVAFLAPEEYREQIAGTETDADEKEAEDALALLRALGLVHGEIDLEEEVAALAGDGSLAYYAPKEEKVYVRGTEVTPGVEATLAHELTHVLQDQHFDLERLSDPELAHWVVLRALAEGDASRIEERYVEEELSDEQRDVYQEESDADAEAANDALEEVSPVLMALFTAPYILGRGFVDHLESGEGESAIDDALRDPPSEQELLNPTVRSTEAAEEVAVEVEAPDGAEVLDEDTFGPLSWYLLLAARGEPVDALLALDDWGGDAFVSYRQDGKVCATAAVAGDDAAATDRMHELLTAWAAAGPEAGAEVGRVGDVVELRSCDPGGDVDATEPAGLVGVFYLPLIRTQMRLQLLASGVPAGATSCAVDEVIGQITSDQLADVGGLLDGLPATVQAAVTACT